MAIGATESARTLRLNRDGPERLEVVERVERVAARAVEPEDVLDLRERVVRADLERVVAGRERDVVDDLELRLVEEVAERDDRAAVLDRLVGVSRTRGSGLRLLPTRGRSSVAYWTRSTLKMRGGDAGELADERVRAILERLGCEIPAGNAKPAGLVVVLVVRVVVAQRQAMPSLSDQSMRPNSVSTSFDVSNSPYCEPGSRRRMRLENVVEPLQTVGGRRVLRATRAAQEFAALRSGTARGGAARRATGDRTACPGRSGLRSGRHTAAPRSCSADFRRSRRS